MADEFASSVKIGLKLSKRIYYGKSASLSAPKPAVMEKSPTKSMGKSMSMPSSSTLEKSNSMVESYLPTAPMVYAVITEPAMVDNPDVPSYQPYVHGKCEPPAMIPLHMHGIKMEVDCYLDTAFVEIRGTWRLHCVAAGRCCDCRIAIPMGEQGSVLGVEVESTRRSYYTQLVTVGDKESSEKVTKARDGFLLRGHIYTLKVSQVEGGSNVSVKVRWSQKLLYEDGELCLHIPFSFPAYVAPFGNEMVGCEKILVNVNSGAIAEISCKSSSHPVKGLDCRAGNLGFLYEAKVRTWSTNDFLFSYSVCTNDIFGDLLLQTSSMHDFDQKDTFRFYLFPGNCSTKNFSKQVVFIVDMSASMRGEPLQNTKDALSAVLTELNQGDYFNIIAFNENIQLFSTKMEMASKGTIERATKWIDTNFIPEGGTNILLPLTQAIKLLTKTGTAIPLIFLITDGTVEDEHNICNLLKGRLRDGLEFPRICTFGIGSYCNHYFLQMLAHIGRGYYDAAYDVDSISERMQRLVNKASSIILADITIDALENLDSLELYPLRIPDLLSGIPLVVSGRYHGNFPDSIEAKGILADLSEFVMNLKVQKPKDVPIDRVLARRHIDMMTAHAWLSGSKQIEEKVVKMSVQTGVPSEYTRMIQVEKVKAKQAPDSVQDKEKIPEMDAQKIIYLRNPGVGFGNLNATAENLPPGTAEVRLSEPSGGMMKATSSCCSSVLDRICCMCLLRACSRMNDQCAIAFTQLCAALACFECMNWCCEICFSCDELCL